MHQVEINDFVKLLVKAQRQESFIDYEKGTDEEALGILVADFCGHSSPAIFEVITAILEDSNFHTLNEQWQKLINPEKEAQP